MQTVSPKQQAIRDREQQILSVARGMLNAEGYHGLNMDSIASAIRVSKGTIYNHFSCKEEIIIALATDTLNRRTRLFECAAGCPETPRGRMCGVGAASELFVELYPEHFATEQLVRSASIWQKTSEKRRQQMQAEELRCMGIVSGIVRDAVSQGHLHLGVDTTPEELVFGLWSQTFGAQSITAGGESLVTHGIRDPMMAVRRFINASLDGFGWRPLSTEVDYIAKCDELKQVVLRRELHDAVT